MKKTREERINIAVDKIANNRPAIKEIVEMLICGWDAIYIDDEGNPYWEIDGEPIKGTELVFKD